MRARSLSLARTVFVVRCLNARQVEGLDVNDNKKHKKAEQSIQAKANDVFEEHHIGRRWNEKHALMSRHTGLSLGRRFDYSVNLCRLNISRTVEHGRIASLRHPHLLQS